LSLISIESTSSFKKFLVVKSVLICPKTAMKSRYTDYILKCDFFIAIKNHLKAISILTNVYSKQSFLGAIQITFGIINTRKVEGF